MHGGSVYYLNPIALIAASDFLVTKAKTVTNLRTP
jgi:hypothetical protein